MRYDDRNQKSKSFRILLILQVSKPTVENVQYALRIEGTDITITLSAR